MLKYKELLMVFVMAVVPFSISTVLADTWRLGEDQDWQAVSAEDRDKFLMAVAETKKLVNAGQAETASQAFDKLKEDFPEI